MFLSNPSKNWLGFVVLALVLSGCAWWNGGSKPEPVTSEPISDIPFSTREPDAYQAFMITTSGSLEEKRFFARKGNKWRLDLYDGDQARSGIIESEGRFLVDHRRKSFTAVEATAKTGGDPDFLQEMTLELLRQHKYTRFEDLGIDGSVRKYRAVVGGSDASAAMIYYDESIGLIVRQEFIEQGESGGSVHFKFELRDLKLDVADDTFKIPDGYKKVPEKEFHSTPRSR